MTTPLDETKNPPTQTPMERGPNYDWKHEAEHYSQECDRLRKLLGQIEAKWEHAAIARDEAQERAATLEQALRNYFNRGVIDLTVDELDEDAKRLFSSSTQQDEKV